MIKAAPVKKAKTRAKIPGFSNVRVKTFNKAGMVIAMDSKFTGEEPMWTGWESWPIDKFFGEKHRALRFYSYYLSASDLRPATIKWMRANGYANAECDMIKNAQTWCMPMTVDKLIRCFDMGMPSLHPKAQEYYTATLTYLEDPVPVDDLTTIHHMIRESLDALRVSDVADPAIKAPMKSPHDRIVEKVHALVLPLIEEALDKWVDNPNQVQNLNVGDLLKVNGIPAQGCKIARDRIERHLLEFEGALNKEDKQLVEGYAYLSRVQKKRIIAGFHYMKDSIGEYSKAKISERKPREKKVKTPTQQVARLNVLETSDRYDLKTVHPVKIPGSSAVYLFDDKYRTLVAYHSSSRDGFQIVGAAIKGWDPDKSYQTKLRKPEDFLTLIQTGAIKKIEAALTALKTKRSAPNGRIKRSQLILRTEK